MEEPTPRADAAVANPPMHTLVLAITAPFGVMVLLASPLLIDALRQAAGI